MYRSVACGFYDRLEALAVRGQRVVFVYTTEAGAVEQRTARLADLYSRDGAEYARLDDETVIRLDWLVSVDGVPVAFAC